MTKSWLVGVAFVLGLAACNSKAGEEQVTQVEALQKKMCDCKDADCANGVAKEFMDWAEKNKGVKVSKANFDKVKAAADKTTECAKKAGDTEADKIDDTLPAAEE